MSTSVFSKLRTTVSFRLFDLRRWFTADCTSLRSIALNSVNAVELPISLEWFSLCVEISVSRSLSSVKKRKFHYQTIHTPFSLELVTLLNYECIELRRRCPDSLSFLFYLWLFVLFFLLFLYKYRRNLPLLWTFIPFESIANAFKVAFEAAHRLTIGSIRKHWNNFINIILWLKCLNQGQHRTTKLV